MTLVLIVLVLLIISFIYSKIATISFGEAFVNVILGIVKGFLAICSFLFAVGASSSTTRNVREQARKQGRDDVVAEIDARREKAKQSKERIDNFRNNMK